MNTLHVHYSIDSLFTSFLEMKNSFHFMIDFIDYHNINNYWGLFEADLNSNKNYSLEKSKFSIY